MAHDVVVVMYSSSSLCAFVHSGGVALDDELQRGWDVRFQRYRATVNNFPRCPTAALTETFGLTCIHRKMSLIPYKCFDKKNQI